MKFLFFLVLLPHLLTVNCDGEEREDLIKRFPFMASLKYESNHTCSAVILAKYLAVTAANCVYNKPWTRFSISVGSSRLDDSPELPIQAVEIHPKYNDHNGDYDVAVVVFEKVTFNETCRPLWWGTRPKYQGSSVITVGWGLEGNETLEERELQYAEGKVISMYKCKKYYNNSPFLRNARVICAVGNGTDLCVAEDGSPLLTVKDYFGLGIASIRGKCPQPDKPLIFMNINSYSIKRFLLRMIKKYAKISSRRMLRGCKEPHTTMSPETKTIHPEDGRIRWVN